MFKKKKIFKKRKEKTCAQNLNKEQEGRLYCELGSCCEERGEGVNSEVERI